MISLEAKYSLDIKRMKCHLWDGLAMVQLPSCKNISFFVVLFILIFSLFLSSSSFFKICFCFVFVFFQHSFLFSSFSILLLISFFSIPWLLVLLRRHISYFSAFRNFSPPLWNGRAADFHYLKPSNIQTLKSSNPQTLKPSNPIYREE